VPYKRPSKKPGAGRRVEGLTENCSKPVKRASFLPLLWQYPIYRQGFTTFMLFFIKNNGKNAENDKFNESQYKPFLTAPGFLLKKVIICL
jgi:hypothetical protein